MPNAWDSLPNGKRIDVVLAHVRAHPEVWTAVLAHVRAHPEVWDVVWDVARPAARDAARTAAWDAAWDVARYATRDAAWDVARTAAWFAVAALVAWDDCGSILDLPPDAVRLLAASGHQPAILLYPAVIALNKE